MALSKKRKKNGKKVEKIKFTNMPGFTNDKAVEIAATLKKMFYQLEQMALFYLHQMIEEEDKDNYFIKTEFDKRTSQWVLQLFNHKTKATVIKYYDLFEVLGHAQSGTVEHVFQIDIERILNKTNEKIYTEVENILI